MVFNTSSLHQDSAGNRGRAGNLFVFSETLAASCIFFSLTCLCSLITVSLTLHPWHQCISTAGGPLSSLLLSLSAASIGVQYLPSPWIQQWFFPLDSGLLLLLSFFLFFFCLDHTTQKNSCNNNRQDKDLMNWYSRCSVFWWFMFNVTIPLTTDEFPC